MTAAFAQEEHPFVRTALSFTPGYLVNQETTTYALGGELEIYPEGKVSVRADGYALLGKADAGGIKQNYQGFLGIAYNFDKLWVFSPFVGFQPGLGLAQAEAPTFSALQMAPVFSPFAGFHYFAETLFHFTLNVRYVYGDLRYPQVGSVNLSEFRLSLGLGIFF